MYGGVRGGENYVRVSYMKRFEHGGNVYGKNIRLDFSVNTNPLGMSGEIKNALVNGADKFAFYPDASCAELRRAIARSENTSAENVVCSNGASEMIFAAVRALDPRRALVTAPSFSEYERALESVGCEIVCYDLSEENGFALRGDFPDAVAACDTAFICTPNNPTGNVFDRDIVEEAVKKCALRGGTVIFDECFAPLSDAYTMKGKAPVIRAFTKTHALAGVRLGYLIADEELCGKVRAQLPMWNVSYPAQIAGAVAARDTESVRRASELIVTERAFLRENLSRLGFTAFDSQAPFLLIKGERGLDEALAERGILIRPCENFVNLDGRYYRVAVRTRRENEELIKEIGDICG